MQNSENKVPHPPTARASRGTPCLHEPRLGARCPPHPSRPGCMPAGPRCHRAHEPDTAMHSQDDGQQLEEGKRCRSARLTRVECVEETECRDFCAHRALRRGTGAGRRRWMTQSPARTPSARTTAPARKTKRSIYVRSKPCDIAQQGSELTIMTSDSSRMRIQQLLSAPRRGCSPMHSATCAPLGGHGSIEAPCRQCSTVLNCAQLCTRHHGHVEHVPAQRILT